MQSPGSNPGIPEQAEIEFKEQWNRAKPGTKHKIGFLQLTDGGRLAVFPHREWDPPLGEGRLCVLFPVRNAAVAAPVGGIPEQEHVEDEHSQAPRQSRATYPDDGVHGEVDLSGVPEDVRRELAAHIGSKMGSIYDALNELEEVVQDLSPEYEVE